MRNKANNQIFTPEHIVSFMLQEVKFTKNNLLTMKFMEPSFGDGAFLLPMITKIIEYAEFLNMPKADIVSILLKNVHGIEKDPKLYNKTVCKINSLLLSHGIPELNWNKNLLCGDTLAKSKKMHGKFDLVIGNPPYTRIHDMDVRTRKIAESYQFASGMKELYILFYEAGINMLNSTGTLCYITPNSFMHNSSQKKFRKYLLDNKLLLSLYDFKDTKVFEGVDTYTCICSISKREHLNITYSNSKDSLPGHCQLYDFDKIPFSNADAWCFEKQVVNTTDVFGNAYKIQYGIATNADKVFVGKAYLDPEETKPLLTLDKAPDKVYFNKMLIESAILKHCVKASTFNGVLDNTYIVFPYVYVNGACKVISEETFIAQYPSAWKYLYKYRKTLLNRKTTEKWYAYGRTQGLKSMNKPKVVFKHMMPNDHSCLEAYILNADTVVYSGMFITVKAHETLNDAVNILTAPSFKAYCRTVGKPMSNNYISISGKNVQKYPL